MDATSASTASDCGAASSPSARSGRSPGPDGELGCARLALTDADRAGPRPRHRLDARPRARRHGRRHRQRRRHPARHRSRRPPPVMTGSHIDTVATGGRFDGNLGVLAGLEVIETLETLGIATRRPISVAFFTDEEGARFAPDMLGSLVYVGGMALEEALDVTAVDDGARLGDELVRIGYAGPLPVPGGVGAARLRRAAHRAGTDPRGRGRDDRCRRGRAGHLVDGADDHRAFGPRRHDADAAAPRPGLRRRGDHDVRARAHQPPRRRPGGHGRPHRPAPEPRQRRAGDGHDHRRPAQHRRGGPRRRRARPRRRGRPPRRRPSRSR